MRVKKETEKKTDSSDAMFLGPWNVGGVHFDSGISKAGKSKFTAICELPGIQRHIGDFDTEDEAVKAVEAAVKNWFSKIPD
jgi:hypothetical protein